MSSVTYVELIFFCGKYVLGKWGARKIFSVLNKALQQI